MKDDFYVTLKLKSGEQLMAVLTDEDEEYVVLDSPIIIKTVPSQYEDKERIVAAPFCQFSDDTVFTLHKSAILYVKKLHESFVSHYNTIVEKHYSTIFVPREEPEEEEFKTFIEGNDTIN